MPSSGMSSPGITRDYVIKSIDYKSVKFLFTIANYLRLNGFLLLRRKCKKSDAARATRTGSKGYGQQRIGIRQGEVRVGGGLRSVRG